ncbi:TPA: trp operon leader peptide [Enterobacter kobei]|nr:trp operon leader peptide [Enterobacter kobei]QIP22498.1 trp operon leader peptide [Enterobacter kobei]HDC4310091.1 trp operon leader peptide [Enterobacter kobei]HDC4520692.1 trp operon leader peptide [Enterobacter kobei]
MTAHFTLHGWWRIS